MGKIFYLKKKISPPINTLRWDANRYLQVVSITLGLTVASFSLHRWVFSRRRGARWRTSLWCWMVNKSFSNKGNSTARFCKFIQFQNINVYSKCSFVDIQCSVIQENVAISNDSVPFFYQMLPLLWFTSVWPSAGCVDIFVWLVSRKGTNECHANTGTERGSTLVQTKCRNRQTFYIYTWLFWKTYSLSVLLRGNCWNSTSLCQIELEWKPFICICLHINDGWKLRKCVSCPRHLSLYLNLSTHEYQGTPITL